MVAGIKIDKGEFVLRMRERAGSKVYTMIDAMEASTGDVNKMDTLAVNGFLAAVKLNLNKTEFENLFDHFASSAATVDMAAFLAAVLDDVSGEDPIQWLKDPSVNPHTAHLALSGVSHIEYGTQDKPFPKHWGAPPNAQLKGHNGIMRTLPGSYGKGNAPMANWVKMNMEKDKMSETTSRGNKPYPYGNYSLGCA